MEDNKHKVIKTWNWTIPEGTKPYQGEVCRRHLPPNDLYPYRFEGEEFYVCPNCGDVYSRSPSGTLNTWHHLYEQPYEWDRRIDRADDKSLAHELIYGNSFHHPFLAAHDSDQKDVRDLLLRYLMRIDHNPSWSGSLFKRKIDEIRMIQNDEEALKIDDETGRYHRVDIDKDLYLHEYLEETKDHLYFDEACISLAHHHIPYDDEEGDSASTLSLEITYLSEDEKDLSDLMISDPISIRMDQHWISKDPFGMKGYYLFEAKCEYGIVPDPNYYFG